MQPSLAIEKDYLVIITPKGKPPTPPMVCWGLVERKLSETLFSVRLGPEPNNTIHASTEQLFPCIKTDGSFNDPQRVFSENEEKIMLAFMLGFLAQLGAIRPDARAPTNLPEPGWVVPIQENALSIILPGQNTNPEEPCWGLIHRRLTGGNYEVRVDSSKIFGTKKIIVQPNQIVPVYLTDGSVANPKRALRRHRDSLFLNLFMMFRMREASFILKQTANCLAQTGFVLVSRKGKIPPAPEVKKAETKKPES